MTGVELFGEQRDGLGVDFRLVPLLDYDKVRLALVPALAALPAVAFEVISGRGGHIRRVAHQIGVPAPVDGDGVFVIRRRQELGLADFAGPIAFKVRGRHVAAVDDAERVEQFGLEFVGAAAVIGERRDRTHNVHFAQIDTVVGLQSPDSHDHGAGYAVFLFDAPEYVGVLLHHLGAFGQPVARNHAAGKLFEALLEHALTPVGREHLVVDGDPVEGGEAAL